MQAVPLPRLRQVGGAGLVLYGSSAVVYSRFVDVHTDLGWWGQAAGIVGSGIVMLAWPWLRRMIFGLGRRDDAEVVSQAIKKALTPDPGSTCCCPPVVETVGCNCSHQLTSNALRDIEALHRLASRLRDHKEGAELCRDINDSLFDIHHAVSSDADVEERPAEETSDDTETNQA
jgi:hypothetical protein